MFSAFIPLVAPILSLCILTLGNGFFTTLTTVQLSNMQLSTVMIGIISASYFAGMMLGSFFSQSIISKIGHIRAYCVFAALMSTSCMFQGIIDNTLIWGILRFVCGYALAGLFIVIESWCIAGVGDQYKGRIMGFYLFAFYFAQSASQLFLKIDYNPELVAFCIISALACFSIIPVCITRFKTPQPETPELVSPGKYFKIVPLGMIAALIAGMILGGIYTMLPLSLKSASLSNSEIAYIMAITIFGGMLFQLPIGKISDSFDRRRVMLVVCILIIIVSTIVCLFHNSFWQLFILCFFIGSVSFAVYPISISHSSDHVDVSKTVAIISIVTLFYGIGSMLGPVVATVFIDLLGGITGFFLFLLVCAAILGIYIFYRMFQREPIKDSEKVHFTPTAPRMAIGMVEVMEQNFNESESEDSDSNEEMNDIPDNNEK